MAVMKQQTDVFRLKDCRARSFLFSETKSIEIWCSYLWFALTSAFFTVVDKILRSYVDSLYIGAAGFNSEAGALVGRIVLALVLELGQLLDVLRLFLVLVKSLVG
jgi:hypothetical protein